MLQSVYLNHWSDIDETEYAHFFKLSIISVQATQKQVRNLYLIACAINNEFKNETNIINTFTQLILYV